MTSAPHGVDQVKKTFDVETEGFLNPEDVPGKPNNSLLIAFLVWRRGDVNKKETLLIYFVWPVLLLIWSPIESAAYDGALARAACTDARMPRELEARRVRKEERACAERANICVIAQARHNALAYFGAARVRE